MMCIAQIIVGERRPKKGLYQQLLLQTTFRQEKRKMQLPLEEPHWYCLSNEHPH
jgi:hypothetical protein